MRLSPPPRSAPLALAAAVAALAVLTLIAWWAALIVENRTAATIRSRLMTDGITWASVSANGLTVSLTGTAPTEAARFRAVNIAAALVDDGRIRDGLAVAAPRAVAAPQFSVEILRNLDGVSLIGLLPGSGTDAATALSDEVARLAGGLPVSDMLESADYPAPATWDAAMDFGMQALRRLPRSKISISADRVAVTAITDSAEEKARAESDLRRLAPRGLRLVLDISAPRPVLTPFTLRFVKDAQGARFDACAADTDRARTRILAAARSAGEPGGADCTVGLGVPSPRWADAAEAAIRAVGELGLATVTFSDADVALIAAPEVDQATFDRVAGELQAALPDAFSLSATLTPQAGPATVAGPAEFTADLTIEGRVTLRGRLTDERQKAAVDSVARALFGSEAVYTATRMDPDLPDGWPVRVLTGLSALAEVREGRLVVRQDRIELTGRSGNQDASDRISQVLSGRLGADATYTVAVSYDQALDPIASIPTPEKCAADLNAVLAARKLVFAPGSAEIDRSASAVVDDLARVLERCPGLTMEIAGHTDSQGRDETNRALSQARADALLIALQGRGLPVEGFIAYGYGASRPIADNDTEAGREANRRLEFVVLQPGAVPGTGGVTPQEAAQAALLAEAPLMRPRLRGSATRAASGTADTEEIEEPAEDAPPDDPGDAPGDASDPVADAPPGESGALSAPDADDAPPASDPITVQEAFADAPPAVPTDPAAGGMTTPPPAGTLPPSVVALPAAPVASDAAAPDPTRLAALPDGTSGPTRSITLAAEALEADLPAAAPAPGTTDDASPADPAQPAAIPQRTAAPPASAGQPAPAPSAATPALLFRPTDQTSPRPRARPSE